MTPTAPRAPLVVVVAYRADEHLRRCLSTLRAGDCVTVVDNDASPVTKDIAEGAGARYVSTEANIGFAAAVNRGLERSWDGESDVLLLNPDALISSSDVARLQRALHADGRRLAAVGPRLTGEDGRPQRADWPVPSPLQLWLEALGAARLWRGRRFVTGAVLLLRGAALSQLGGLDERYFLYAEEADWQLRAQHAGWDVAVVPEVSAMHAGAASSADSALREALFHASAEAFARRWYGRRGWQLMRAAAVVAATRRVLLGPAARRPANRRVLRIYLSGSHTTPARPKVVHVVCSSAFAGVERYVADCANELHRRGWSVTVIGADATRMRAELAPGVAHELGTTLGQVVAALWSAGRVEVVHAHMTAAELPAALLKWRNRAPLLVTRHFATPRGRSRLGTLARPVITRGVDQQLAISRFVAESVSDACTVVLNGVPRSVQPRRPRAKTVVLLQRLEAEKDTGTALRAWRASKLADDGWTLEVYGSGAERDALRDLAAELGVARSVHFNGVTDDSRKVLAEAGLLLATAGAEPFGLAVVEAMAEGTPVIAAAGGAHLETLGELGCYFPPGDAEGCAAQLTRLAEAPQLRDKLGDQLRQRHAERFTIERHVDELVQRYEAVMRA